MKLWLAFGSSGSRGIAEDAAEGEREPLVGAVILHGLVLNYPWVWAP